MASDLNKLEKKLDMKDEDEDEDEISSIGSSGDDGNCFNNRQGSVRERAMLYSKVKKTTPMRVVENMERISRIEGRYEEG